MKRLIAILFLISSLAIADDFNVVGFACTDDIFAAHRGKVVDGLAYVMFRSDYQTEYMTNGVLSQFNFQGFAQKNDITEPVYLWNYSEPKAQRLSESDIAYISNKMSVAQTRFYYGPHSGVWSWVDTFAQAGATNEVPVVIGDYDDGRMQNDALWFVSSVLPNAWSDDKADWVNGWLDIAGLPHTEANTNLVESKLIKGTYVLAANTNQEVWVIKQDTKTLDNATLEQRDAFRASVAAPYRPTIGFLRNSLKREYMDHFGIKEK